MRPFCAAVLFALILTISTSGQTQQAGTQTAVPTQSDPPAMQTIQASFTAMGAAPSPSAAVMTSSQGTVTYPDGSTQQITVETIGNNLIRHQIGQNNFIFVANAGDGFLSLAGQRYNLPSWSTAYQRAEHMPHLSLMSDSQNPNFVAKYVGVESVNGNPAIHLRLSMLATDGTPSDLQDLMSEFHVWIDQVSMLVVKTRHFDFSPQAIQNRTPVDTYYSDYRRQDGVMVPFHFVRFVGENQQFAVQFATVSLAATVSPVDFQ